MIDISTLSDSALVIAIARFQETALAEAYRRHGGAVWALCKQVVRSDALADEITQDVFLRLWREPERFDATRGSLRAFLNSIAHSRAVDLLRSEAARVAREERDARATATGGYDLERHVWDMAEAEHVRAALHELPQRERVAIHLAYFEGYTYREIAELQGEPEGTVKSRIRAGLRRMRAMLRTLDSEPIEEPR